MLKVLQMVVDILRGKSHPITSRLLILKRPFSGFLLQSTGKTEANDFLMQSALIFLGAMSNFSVGSSDGRSLRNIAPVICNPLLIELKKSPSIASSKEHSKQGLRAPYAAFACSVTRCPSCALGLFCPLDVGWYRWAP